MNKEESIKYCIDGVKDFLEIDNNCKNIDEKLYSLKNFCFEDLKNSDYGKCQSNFDADNTKLATMIYFLLWHDSNLPNIQTLDEMQTNYGGETINNYRPLLGEHCEYEKYFKPSRTEEENINIFIRKTKTIGNFMILPKNPKYNNKSINQYIGYGSIYHDYADLVLFDLFNTNNLDMFKTEYDKFCDLDATDFCKVFFLEDFLDTENKPHIKFKHEKFENRYYAYYHYRYKKPCDDVKSKFKEFTIDYIEKSLYIINKRADKMCSILKDRLKS